METREELGNRLLAAVCRELQWSTDPRGAPTRLDDVIRAHRMTLVMDGLELSAWLTSDVELAVRVRVDAWGPSREDALRRAVEAQDGLVAELLLLEWTYVTHVCKAAAKERGGAD